VGAVVEGLLSAGVRRVRVIDNGSSDRTVMVSTGAGADVLREPVAGYGRACWLGLQELPEWVEWVLFCDADGSDDLAQLPSFFEAARDADFILGARYSPPGARNALTPPQRFGNALSTALIRLGWGYRYRDLGPFRLIRRKALEDIGMRDRSWGWTLEMQVRSVENKLRIKELPVIALPRRTGRSKISGSIAGSIRAGVVILRTLSRLYWGRRP
jgi:glycosyltransferase involved in cell wall biosynthesis